jgi:hypothetical protein
MKVFFQARSEPVGTSNKYRMIGWTQTDPRGWMDTDRWSWTVMWQPSFLRFVIVGLGISKLDYGLSKARARAARHSHSLFARFIICLATHPNECAPVDLSILSRNSVLARASCYRALFSLNLRTTIFPSLDWWNAIV